MNGIDFVLDIILYQEDKEQIIQWYFDTGTYRYFQPIPMNFTWSYQCVWRNLSRRRNLKYFVLKITLNLKTNYTIYVVHLMFTIEPKFENGQLSYSSLLDVHRTVEPKFVNELHVVHLMITELHVLHVMITELRIVHLV